MAFGLTPTGFVKKLFVDVRDSIVTDVRSRPGLSRLNLGRDAFLGNVVEAIAAAIAEPWDVLGELYASWDPDGSTGRSLDNVCALTGTRRRPATATVVEADVLLDPGVYPPGSLIAARAGIPSIQYVNQLEIVNGGATAAVLPKQLFICTTTGANPCPAGTLTVIASAYPGWGSVTNALDGVTGQNDETDAELRLRREQELGAGGGSTADAVVDAFLRDVRVKQCYAFSNDLDTDATIAGTAFVLPPHSFLVMVYDGTLDGSVMPAADIVALVWKHKPNGVRTVGTSSALTPDRNGQLQTVYYSRPEVLEVYLAITVTAGSEWNAVATPAAIKAALVAYGAAAYESGSDVIRAFLYAPITGVPGVGDVANIQLGLAPSPSGTANILVGPLQIAALDTSRITVNGS